MCVCVCVCVCVYVCVCVCVCWVIGFCLLLLLRKKTVCLSYICDRLYVPSNAKWKIYLNHFVRDLVAQLKQEVLPLVVNVMVRCFNVVF